MFLYKEVLGRELEWLDNVERAKRPARVPGVLTEAGVRAVLAQMDSRHALMVGDDPDPAQARACQYCHHPALRSTEEAVGGQSHV